MVLLGSNNASIDVRWKFKIFPSTMRRELPFGSVNLTSRLLLCKASF